MLEAKDYRALDMVFPFIGAFIDRCCDESDTAPITSIFTQYTDILHWAMRYGISPDWTQSEAERLKSTLQSFKEYVEEVFRAHNVLGMKTSKSHLLNHISGDICAIGGLRNCDVGVFEHSHILFKQSYRQTSKRKATAMEESVRRIGENRNSEVARQCPQKHSGLTGAQRSIQPEDGAVLVPDGMRIKLMYFKETCIAACTLVRDVEGLLHERMVEPLQSSHPPAFVDLFFQLRDQGAISFINLIEEEVPRLESYAHPFHVHFNVLKSAYVMRGHTITLDDFDRNNKTLRYQSFGRHKLQRLFATSSFGASRKALFSDIIIAAPPCAVSSTLWVGKARALIRLTVSDLEDEHSYVFVQFMDCTEPQEEVDDILGCVCLRWSSDDNQDYTPNPVLVTGAGRNTSFPNVALWYGLVKGSAVMGTVHVIRQNFPAKPFVYPLQWKYHRLQINRFYKDHSREFVTFDDGIMSEEDVYEDE